MSRPTIAVLGAGPVGIDAALAAIERGFPVRVFEAAPNVGGNVRTWSHVRMFTPWDLNVSPRMKRALETAGRDVPSGEACPTGGELLERLLVPLAELPGMEAVIRTGVQVRAVGRRDLLKHEEIGSGERARRPFRILVGDARGRESLEEADIVLDCTGSLAEPNALGSGGIDAPGEREAADLISRRIPDVGRDTEAWAGRRLLLVGAGHSAQTAAGELAWLAREKPARPPHVVWAIRTPRPTWGAVENDPLPERAALAALAERLASGEVPAIEARTGVTVERLVRRGDEVEVTLVGEQGDEDTVVVDGILALTGAVGDHMLYRQLQVHECYATSGPMKLSAALLGAGSEDCMAQTTHGAETLTNPEPGFFLLGSKSYGRNTTFLLRVGWEQVDEVFGLLAPAAA